MTEKITGMIAAPLTPMHPDGALNLDKVPDMVDMLSANGIKGIFVCGSTGEGPSLTSEERKDLTEAFVKAADKQLKVFVHVGHNSIAEAKALAVHAQSIGADYISATPPSYFKINTIDTLIACLTEIASGAPELPLYYYNIPAMTGVNLDMVAFLEQAQEALPALAGIKYTTPYIHEYQACLNHFLKKYDVLYGTDEMLLSALATGANGFIGSTYNFAAPLYHHLIEAFNTGNIEKAQRLQLLAVEMVRIIVRYGGLRGQKAMMKLIGMDCGPVRLPLVSLSNQELNALENDLQKIGFFDWASKVGTVKSK